MKATKTVTKKAAKAKTVKAKTPKPEAEAKVKVEPISKVCKVCGDDKPIGDFRLHKHGYRLNKCYACEKESWKTRSKKKDTTEAASTLFPITTKAGQTFNVSSAPIKGGRKLVSPATDKVLYTPAEVTRDQARALFQVYADVPRTGISASVVE
jgi:hypothetical protein